MKLSDLRRFTVKKQVRIRFPLSGGLECVVNEHGVAEVPDLKAVPDFNLEEQLTAAEHFQIEPVEREESRKAKSKTESLTREQMSALMASGPGRAGQQEED